MVTAPRKSMAGERGQSPERLLTDMSAEVASLRWAAPGPNRRCAACSRACRMDRSFRRSPAVLVTCSERIPRLCRACMDQFIGGIRPGEEAQVQQAKVVQRVQTSLERLAALGQAAHAVLPPNLHEVPARVLHLALVLVWERVRLRALAAGPRNRGWDFEQRGMFRSRACAGMSSWLWKRAIGPRQVPMRLPRHNSTKTLEPAWMWELPCPRPLPCVAAFSRPCAPRRSAMTHVPNMRMLARDTGRRPADGADFARGARAAQIMAQIARRHAQCMAGGRCRASQDFPGQQPRPARAKARVRERQRPGRWVWRQAQSQPCGDRCLHSS